VKHILVIGAGRSSTYLIQYLLNHAAANDWKITVGDLQLSWAEARIGNHPRGKAIALDLADSSTLHEIISNADLVVSLAPADKHIRIAEACLAASKSLFTASYVSNEMAALHEEAKKKGLLFLNELGCDPGIDHMSALKIIADIKASGGTLNAFYSYTGGLIAHESNDQPWHYKFSWNPRNVILAGQPGPARYLANGVVRFLPYQRLFAERETIDVPDFGKLEGYANRDSLPYRELYGLEKIGTLVRGTLRYPTYCDAWHVFVWLGMTDDKLIFNNCHQLRYRDYLLAFLSPDNAATVRESFINALKYKLGYSDILISDILDKFDYLELFSDRTFQVEQASSAQLLQFILEEKWKLSDTDRDLLVMYHKFEYELEGTKKTITSTLVLEGEDNIKTAMAKTVGLPLAIAVRLYLEKKYVSTGVEIPNNPQLYQPILHELEEYGIHFNEVEA
jgi:saccharopine dehydrogenase (NADP+, L-glutamate forming)